MSSNYRELFHALGAEFALIAGALLVLAADLAFGKNRSLAARLTASVTIAVLAIAASIGLTLQLGHPGAVFGDVLNLDLLAVPARIGVLALTLLTLGIASGTTKERNPAEFVAITLFAATGLILMAAAQQLLLAFLAIELASLSLYILVGLDKSRPESAEAGLKYFLFGGMSAAFLLFGFSLLYGLTGSIDLHTISVALGEQPLTPLHAVALVMILVAFGFKSAAAPFHLWAPDVYQGAPASSAALVASASKLAGFTLFARLLWPGLHAMSGEVATARGTPGWLPVAAVLSALSLLVGNFGALAQTNVRRLLAYSAIAHAGALLLGVIAVGFSGPAPLFYYASTYGMATVGAFGVIAVVDRTNGCQRIDDLAGLHRRSPLLAGCLFVFILSLAGIPPLAGFFGKFSVFAAALGINGVAGPAGWLTLAAIFMSAVALYYYLIVLKQALVAGPRSEHGPIHVPLAAGLSLLIAAGGLVVLGVFPSILLRLF
jgi:NADH-quinone oxidoreductase subunit N